MKPSPRPIITIEGDWTVEERLTNGRQVTSLLDVLSMKTLAM